MNTHHAIAAKKDQLKARLAAAQKKRGDSTIGHGVTVKQGNFRAETTDNGSVKWFGPWRKSMRLAVLDMPGEHVGNYGQWL